MKFAIIGSMKRLVPLLCLVSMLLRNGIVMGTIGVITDKNSRKGKEEIVAIKMALEHFYQYTNQSFALHIANSHGDPLQAALAGQEPSYIKKRTYGRTDTLFNFRERV
ncbi:hypothetical protein CR513_14159, partial [Mucuna pruriens]